MSDPKINILLVDDVPGKLLALEAILEELGQNLVAVTSGREALRRVMQEDFAVILLDVSMPDMDGFETASLIRQRKRTEHTPIIFITAEADETHSRQGYSLGAVDYILAPVIPEVLRAKVSVFVELFRMQAQIREQAEQRVALAQEQALRMAAEKANRSKNEFLANISHELRTPMNAIIGMTELALQEEISPEAREYLWTARSSAGVLLGLLNEILDLSRLESGKFTLDESPFRLRPVLDETLKTLSVRAYEKKLEIVGEYPTDMPDAVIGDSLRIRQVLMNLLGNAIKFTREGEVALRISVESETATDITYLGSVSDTGIGIALEDRERIFAPFTQADASTTRNYGGTGLGLAIASDLVQMMGGRIWVESRVGAGSTFYFTFRLRRNASAAAPVVEDPGEMAALRGMEVLVADGHAATRRVLASALAGWSLHPEAVRDGAMAVRRLESAASAGRPLPIVIVDRQFPGTNGAPLVDRLLQHPEWATTTILMLPPAERQRAAERFASRPNFVILEKPVTQRDLFHALRNACFPKEPLLLPGPRETSPSEQRPPLSILLDEDTPANQKLLKAILEKRGHRVSIARDGREAVERTDVEAFDLVLMDVQMPVMDGFKATALIRSREPPEGPRLPIIALTAHAMQGDRERCLAAGMDGYIPKPIEVETLFALIDRTTESRSAPDSTPDGVEAAR